MIRIVVLSLLLAAAAVLALPFPPEQAVADSPAREVLAGAPYGLVPCDLVPFKPPEPWEAEEDRLRRPYELLVRLHAWPDLEPLDAELAQIVVPGAATREKRAPGIYSFSRINVGVTSLAVYDSPPEADPSPGTNATFLALRNPLSLARDAVTVCDLVVVPLEQRSREIPVRGTVSDRFTLEPLPGVIVALPSGVQTATDEDGGFGFPGPVALQDLLDLWLVRPGYRDQGQMILLFSNLEWMKHLRATGEMLLGMRPVGERPALRPFLPLDENHPR